MIEEGLVTWLKANIALAGTRVHRMKLPQNPVLPAITYFKVSGVRWHSHQGPSGIAQPRFQISCWGTTYDDAKHLSEEVRKDMDCYTGLMGVVRVQACFLLNEIDLSTPEVGIYQVALDFQIVHEEI